VYRLTGSSLLLGTVGFAGQIPVFLLASVGGMLADRHNRHRIVIGTQTSAMVLAFILAGLTLLGIVQVWHIMVLAALLGVVNKAAWRPGDTGNLEFFARYSLSARSACSI
jgi:nitrate/nitrite transporter NarK